MTSGRFLLLLVLLLVGNYSLSAAEVEPVAPPYGEEELRQAAARVTPHPRQLHYQQLETVAFIHFGMNTFTGREWGDGTDDPSLFNPTNLDANQWVRVLKQAGFRLLIFTAKHHDGFCLWPSDFTDYDIAASPWKNGEGNLLRDVVDACNVQGMEIGLYLSPWDRHHPEFGNSDVYNTYYKNQLREILTNYGPFSEVWFDGAGRTEPGPGGVQKFDDAGFWRIIRELAPDAVLVGMGPDVRWVGNEAGYAREAEWSVLPLTTEPVEPGLSVDEMLYHYFTPKNRMDADLGSRDALAGAKALFWYPAEADVSIRPGWFYHPEEDGQIKSVAALTDIYFNSVGRNAVMLLNIPPNQQGLITQADADTLIAWRNHLDQIFAHNLAEIAVIDIENGEGDPASLADGDPQTSVHLEEGSAITLRFDSPVTFDCLLLQEDIAQGQHVEEWVVEYKLGGSWQPITSGPTIGNKRLIRLNTYTVQQLRLRLLETRGTTYLNKLGMYRGAALVE